MQQTKSHILQFKVFLLASNYKHKSNLIVYLGLQIAVVLNEKVKI